MPRANRYFSPHHVWHIAYRCHQKYFLRHLDSKQKLPTSTSTIYHGFSLTKNIQCL